MPYLRQAVAKYILYGNKLQIAASKGLMHDTQASMMLMEYADPINTGLMREAAFWNQINTNLPNSINANGPIVCTTQGAHTICQ